MATTINENENGTSFYNETASDLTKVPALPRCRWPAPHPDWDVAFATWGSTWMAHIIIFVVAYAILAIYTCSVLCFLVWKRCSSVRGTHDGILTKRLTNLRIALHSLVFVACSARTMSLGIDPYGTRKILKCPSGVVLWSLGWPSLVSSFSILLLLLLETTRLSLAPPRIQRPSVLGSIIGFSLGYVLFSDFLVAYDNSTKYAVTVCQMLFILWGVLVFFGFVYVWWKIHSNLTASSRGQTQTSSQRDNNDNSKMRKLNTIIFVSAAIGICLTVSNLYWVSATLDKSYRPEALRPWPWLLFSTCQRILEVSISIMILLTVSKSGQSSKVDDNANSNNTVPTATA